MEAESSKAVESKSKRKKEKWDATKARILGAVGVLGVAFFSGFAHAAGSATFKALSSRTNQDPGEFNVTPLRKSV